MISKFGESVAQLPPASRLRFYELLAHELTIAVRVIWADEEISAEAKVECMKRINEIMHRVTAKISCERTQAHEWLDTDLEKMVVEWTNQTANLEPLINYAIERSYGLAQKNQ
jgi:hypothetical protein